MQVFRFSLPAFPASWEMRLRRHNVLALDPGRISGMDELRLAYALAKKSIQKKQNIARELHLEMLLWLSGTRDIRQALKNLGAKNPRDFLLVVFGPSSPVRSLCARVRPLKLKKKAGWMALERIALGRVI